MGGVNARCNVACLSRALAVFSTARPERQPFDGLASVLAQGSGLLTALARAVMAGVTTRLEREGNPDGALTVAAVCARGGSKGVPRKNVRLLHGKPLIAYALEQAHASGIFDRIVTSTDDEEIADVARRFGAEVPFIRPAQLAQDTSNKWDVFRHLVTELEAHADRKVGIIADLDTGAALRTADDIRGCVEQLIVTGADVCVTAYEADHNPYYNMVELDAQGLARVVLPPAVPVTNRQQAPPVYNLSPSIFAIRRDALWRHGHWSQCKMTLYVVPRDRAVDIDTEFDFRLVEVLMERQMRAAAPG